MRARDPEPLDDGLDGGLGGNRTLISWMQARNPPVERRAHLGEDNGTRTRTPALTTRRLSLRLCPPQHGATLGWSARGDSNPDLHGLNVPRLPIAPRADVVTMGRVGLHGHGPSGWTRTTTS